MTMRCPVDRLGLTFIMEEREKPEPFTQGLVEVFGGQGKGKTSAALGVVLRAAGHGLHAHVVFFMKGEYPYGERKSLNYLPNVTFASFGHADFVDQKNVKPEEREQARQALEEARRAIFSGDYQLVVLDEVNVAVSFGLLDVKDVLRLIEERPRDVELILTGRGAHPEVVKVADVVTEMLDIKHPFEKGTLARKGIDY